MIYVVLSIAIIATLIVLYKKKIIFKDENKPHSTFSGLTLPDTYGRTRPDGGMFYWPTDYSFEPDNPMFDAVMGTIDAAVKKAIDCAIPVYGDKVPPASECRVMILQPTATSEEGLPCFMITPMSYSTGKPIGPSVKSAGTVINTGQSNTPAPGKLTNPCVVVPIQKDWDRLDYLFNCVRNEMEHLIERWVSFEEFAGYSGANDFHPHRPDESGQ